MTEVLTRQYTTAGGLALLIYDQVLTWDNEVKYIWKSSEWTLKLTFFIARYWTLITQIINLICTHPVVLEKRMIACHSWFAFQTTSFLLLVGNFELTTMLRVYALYERNLTMGVVLTSWFFLSRGVSIWSGNVFVQSLEVDRNCIMIRAPTATMNFSILLVLNQWTLWCLTNSKYRDAARPGWSQNPIVRLVMRDSSWSCLSLSVLVIAPLPYSLYVQPLGHIMYSLMASVLSIMTCRMILNMRSLKGSEYTSGLVFTTDAIAMD